MSVVLRIFGNQHAGLGMPFLTSDASTGTHAIIWYGSAASVVDLHSSALASSAATCTNGAMQGGYGTLKVKSGGKTKTTPPNHALAWFGSAASMIDLNPANVSESKINGCDGAQEAGYIMPVSPGFTHATLWN